MAARTIVDQMVAVLELDSAKFEAGIAAAMAQLQALAGIIKLVDVAVAKVGTELKGVGLAGVTAAKQTTVGLNQMSAAITAATAKVEGLKRSFQTGATGAAKVGTEAETSGRKISSGLSGGRLFGLISAASIATRIFVQIARDMQMIVDKLNEMVGIGAMKKWAFDAADASNKLWRFADGLHLGIRELQAWHDAVGMYGGSNESFDRSVENISAKIGTLGTKLRGAKMVEQLMGLAGIKESEVKGSAAFSVLDILARRMASGQLTDQQAMTIARRLGIDEHTMQILKQAGVTLKPLLEELRKWGNTDEEIKKAAQTELAWDALNRQWEHAKVVLVSELQPAVEVLGELLTDVVQWIRANPEEARNIFYGLAAAVTVVTAAMAILTVVAATLVIAVIGPLVLFFYALAKQMRSAEHAADTFTNKLRALFNVVKPVVALLSALTGGGGVGALLSLRLPGFTLEPATATPGATPFGGMLASHTVAPAMAMAAAHRMTSNSAKEADVKIGTLTIHNGSAVDAMNLKLNHKSISIDTPSHSTVHQIAGGQR